MKYLKNAWYCVAWSEEIEDKPKGLRVLGEYIVVYRGTDKQVIAMEGRCPHRFAPLDLGVVIDNSIMCPYHGLQFGSDGICKHNPHGDGFIPPNAKLKTYRVVEHNTALFVWMGDEENIDESLLPERTALESDLYSSKRLYINLPVHYQLIIDNLLDLTHAPFIHQSTLASTTDGEEGLQNAIIPRHEYSKDGDIIHSNYYIDAMPPSPQVQRLFDDPLGSFEALINWRPASNLTLDVNMKPLEGGKAEAVHLPTVHYLTPETESSTHYFASISRNVKLDKPEEDKHMVDFVVKAFTEEDEPMIIACQDLMEGNVDLLAMKPVILKTDVAGVQARRILTNKIANERG